MLAQILMGVVNLVQQLPPGLTGGAGATVTAELTTNVVWGTMARRCEACRALYMPRSSRLYGR